MDFITLATETDPRRLMRLLGIDSNVDNDSNENDEQRFLLSNNSTVSKQPLLSKTAEAELYLLATNFLLYVAMVIIATLVAKIYFPVALQGAHAVSPRDRARHFSYRRRRNGGSAVQQEEEEEEYYGSDVEDEEDEGLGEHGGSDGDDVDELLDSGDDDENDNNAGARRTSSGRGATTSRRRFNFLEFQQASLSKAQVIQRLVFCCLMLNITFVLWGALQV
jgi:hypothetical protein